MPIALEDLGRDGDHKLLIGDLGSGQYDMKLKVFKGEMKIKLYLSLQLLFFLPWFASSLLPLHPPTPTLLPPHTSQPLSCRYWADTWKSPVGSSDWCVYILHGYHWPSNAGSGCVVWKFRLRLQKHETLLQIYSTTPRGTVCYGCTYMYSTYIYLHVHMYMYMLMCMHVYMYNFIMYMCVYL